MAQAKTTTEQPTAKVVKVKRYRLNPVKMFLKSIFWLFVFGFIAILGYVILLVLQAWNPGLFGGHA